MSKTSKMRENIFGHKRSRDLPRSRSRDLKVIEILILVAYVRMHLCAKFDANQTIRLRVIQMAPNVTDRLSNRQTEYTQFITIPSKKFCGNNIEGFI